MVEPQEHRTICAVNFFEKADWQNQKPTGTSGYPRDYRGAKHQGPAPRPLPDPALLPTPLVVRRVPALDPRDPPLEL